MHALSWLWALHTNEVNVLAHADSVGGSGECNRGRREGTFVSKADAVGVGQEPTTTFYHDELLSSWLSHTKYV